MDTASHNSPINKEYYCYDDFRNLASSTMTKQNYNYYYSGSMDQITLQRNVDQLKKIQLNPRTLINIQDVDTSVTLLGEKISMPICIAPTAMNKLAHPEGEKNSSRACLKYNIVFNLSTLSTSTIKEVAESTNCKALNWYQLYIKDQETTEKLFKQVEQYGFKAIVITVDTPKLGKRINDIRNNFSLPSDIKLELFDQSGNEVIKSGQGSGLANLFEKFIKGTFNWNDIAFYKKMTKLPIILKGIQQYQDAKKAAEYGVHVWVSNHGARQLDTVRGTIEMLGECVQGVRDSNMKGIEIYVDGGIRTGDDVLKCLAIGANCVFTGRGVIYANACEGQRGIEKYLEMLKQELKHSMQLVGVKSVKELNQIHLIKQTIPQPNL